MIHWQPGFVYPPVFYPPHLPLDALHAVLFVAIAAAVGAIAYRRPAYGIAALILCAPFAEARYLAGTSITVPKVALIGFVCALLVRRESWACVSERPARAIAYGFGAVLMSIVLSGWYAVHHDAVVREFAKWFEYALTFAAVVVAFASDRDERPVWIALSAIALVEVALALFELLFGAASGVIVNDANVPRLAGSLEGPNQFAGWWNVVLPVLFARALQVRTRAAIATVVLCALADAATLSRSGIVASAVAIAIVLIASRPSVRVRTGFAIGVVAVAGALVTLGLAAGLQSRFFRVDEMAHADHLGTRWLLWTSAIELWRSSPVLGIGAGNFERELGTIGHPDVQTHANSIYLQSLAETGIVGLGAMLALIWASIATFARARSQEPLVVGMLAASVALALHQVFDDIWFFPKAGMSWAILLAAGVVAIAVREEKTLEVAIADGI